MTVKEFVDKNSDILIRPMTVNEFKDLTDGCVVFCVTATVAKKPIEERAVKAVGYHMVVHRDLDHAGKMIGISTISHSYGGYAKVDYTNVPMIDKDGYKIFYHCKPLPLNDPRGNNNWDIGKSKR